jgi:hypothetical protein
MAYSRARAAAAPPGSERKFKVGKMAVRTRWFDDQIEAALGMPISRERQGGQQRRRYRGVPAGCIWQNPGRPKKMPPMQQSRPSP